MRWTSRSVTLGPLPTSLPLPSSGKCRYRATARRALSHSMTRRRSVALPGSTTRKVEGDAGTAKISRLPRANREASRPGKITLARSPVLRPRGWSVGPHGL